MKTFMAYLGQGVHSRYLTANLNYDGLGEIFVLSDKVDAASLKSALSAVIARHESLRTLFYFQDGCLKQFTAPMSEFSAFEIQHCSKSSTVEAEFIPVQAGEEILKSFNIGRLPLVKLVLFMGGDLRPDRVLLAVHHLVCDGFSYGLIWRDLWRAYREIRLSRDPLAASASVTLAEFVQALEQRRTLPSFEETVRFWNSRQSEASALIPRHAITEETDIHANAATACFVIDEPTTGEFKRVLRNSVRTSFQNALAACVSYTLAARSGGRHVALEFWMSGHRLNALEGRSSDFVGSCAFPTYLSIEITRLEIREIIRAIDEETEFWDVHGLNFGLGIYHGGAQRPFSKEMRPVELPQVSFNFIGNLDAGRSSVSASLAGTQMGVLKDPKNRRFREIAIDCRVMQDRLEVEIQYSKVLHDRKEIEGFRDDLELRVRTLAADGAASLTTLQRSPRLDP